MFVTKTRLAHAQTLESARRDPDTVREPDVAFFSTARGGSQPTTGYAEQSPDLVAEIVSPSNKSEQVAVKANMWLEHGVRLVWVVHPDSRSVDVYQADTEVVSVAEEGPGRSMSCRVQLPCASLSAYSRAFGSPGIRYTAD